MISRFTRKQIRTAILIARNEAGRKHLALMLETQQQAAESTATLIRCGAGTPDTLKTAEAIAYNITVLEKALGGLHA
ncbi:hypothetical protein GCM10027431_32730 [Lysobacter rhizosphaerae]